MSHEHHVSVGDRVRGQQAVGGGMFKVLTGTVTEIEEEWPLPTFDGPVVFIDGEPVRADNVELIADG